MNASDTCPECGKPLPASGLHGLCPECMMKVGLDTRSGQGEPGAPPSDPALPLADVAKLFPQLEIIEYLGRGGMGAVYKARQPRLDRLVALKLLTRGAAGTLPDPHFAERFEREARALARLNHPNIVAVYDFGEAGNLPYFIMEYVDGVNLRQLERAGRLSPAEALRIVPQICEALQFAHEAGVVHRDVKPENILLDQKGRVKIADFGIAKLLGGVPAPQTLTQGQVLGTPHYMAPEQVEHPQKVDQRADIYSLGVVFYEMLTGELPLGKFAPPSRKVQVDVRLDQVVLRTLEKEPERRYQQASQVKTDVEMIAGEPAQGTPQPVSNAQWDRLTVTDPLHRAMWWSALIAGLVGLPGGILLNLSLVWGLSICGVVLGAVQLDLLARWIPPMQSRILPEQRRRSLWYGVIVCLAGVPVGIALKLPYVWGLSVCGIVLGLLKLGVLTGPPTEAARSQMAAKTAAPATWGGSSSLLTLFLLPPLLFTIFLLIGYRWVGVDFNATTHAFTGLLGLPLSSAFGALLAWAAWLGLRPPQLRNERPAATSGQWSWLALGAAAVLGISLPLGGTAMVLIQLIGQDPSWNPGRGEFIIAGSCVGGAVISALASTLMGWESLARLRRASGVLRGRPAAMAAAWFWPCLLVGGGILWGASNSLRSLQGGDVNQAGRSGGSPRGGSPAAQYETVLVTRGPLTMIIAASGRLTPASGDPSPWQIEAGIPETCVAFLEAGQEVDCVADAFPDRHFKGKLAQIGDSPQTDKPTPTYGAIVQITETGLKFRRGMSVMLAFIIAHRQETLRIPCQALSFQIPGVPASSMDSRVGYTPRELAMADAAQRTARTVWVLRHPKQKPEPVPIRIGISEGGLTEVVEGLREGERVIIGISKTANDPI